MDFTLKKSKYKHVTLRFANADSCMFFCFCFFNFCKKYTTFYFFNANYFC